MPSPAKRSTRVFTVSFPPDLARQVQETARTESRNISELMREAFRTYQASQLERRLALARTTLTKSSFTEADVVRLVKEVRAERALAKLAKTKRA